MSNIINISNLEGGDLLREMSQNEISKPKLAAPRLEAISRDTASDVVKYIAYKKKMIIYLKIMNLLEIVLGNEYMDSPDYDMPTRSEIERVYANRERHPVRFKKLIKRVNYLKEYKSFLERKNIAMGILSSSLNDEASIEFLRDDNDEDVIDPHQLFSNIDDYFLYNTEIIIQNLKNEVKDMKLVKGMSMEALGKQMKFVYYHLHVLGKGEDNDSKKTSLANAILRDPAADGTKKTVILQIIGSDNYSLLTFDEMINKIKNMEQFMINNVVDSVKVKKIEESRSDLIKSKQNDQTADTDERMQSERLDSAHAAKSYGDNRMKNMRFKGTCNKCGGVGHKEADCSSRTYAESDPKRKRREDDEERYDQRKRSDRKRGKKPHSKSSRDSNSDDDNDSVGYLREYDIDDGDSVTG